MIGDELNLDPDSCPECGGSNLGHSFFRPERWNCDDCGHQFEWKDKDGLRRELSRLWEAVRGLREENRKLRGEAPDDDEE